MAQRSAPALRLTRGVDPRPSIAMGGALRAGWAAAGLAGLAVLAMACDGAPEPREPEPARAEVEPGRHPEAVIHVKDHGDIRIELLPEIAPKTVDNFVTLAEEGFYDGTTFHRVIPGFMLQGGDPNTRNVDPRDDGEGGPGYQIQDELTDFPHDRGVVSMANKGTPNTGGSQFFIVHQDAPHLDGQYAAFGRVVEGMDVVDAITEVEIDQYGRWGPRNRPYPEDVVIESIEVRRVRGAPARPEPPTGPEPGAETDAADAGSAREADEAAGASGGDAEGGESAADAEDAAGPETGGEDEDTAETGEAAEPAPPAEPPDPATLAAAPRAHPPAS